MRFTSGDNLEDLVSHFSAVVGAEAAFQSQTEIQEYVRLDREPTEWAYLREVNRMMKE